MSAGLQIWDNYGQLIFDTEDITISVLGTFTIGGGGSSSGSFVDNRLLIGGNPFSQIQSASLNNSPVYMSIPTISFSGSTVYWSFPSSANGNFPACRILYGVA